MPWGIRLIRYLFCMHLNGAVVKVAPDRSEYGIMKIDLVETADWIGADFIPEST
jgi:hypothetical protein